MVEKAMNQSGLIGWWKKSRSYGRKEKQMKKADMFRKLENNDLKNINGGGIIQTAPAMPGIIIANAIIKWLQK